MYNTCERLAWTCRMIYVIMECTGHAAAPCLERQNWQRADGLVTVGSSANKYPAVLYLSFSNGQISKLCYLWMWDGPVPRCFYSHQFPVNRCVSFNLTVAACSTSSINCMQLYSAIAHADCTSQSPSSVNFRHSLSAPTAALKSLTARLRSSFNHSQKKQCRLQVNAASTHSPTGKKAQIAEERNRRESEGRSTSRKDLALWAKTKILSRCSTYPEQSCPEFYLHRPHLNSKK